METAGGKLCPIRKKTCNEASCAWWCGFAGDCAVPLLAGLIADSTINRVIFGDGMDKKEAEHDGK